MKDANRASYVRMLRCNKKSFRVVRWFSTDVELLNQEYSFHHE
jgi:hypothetical protein